MYHLNLTIKKIIINTIINLKFGMNHNHLKMCH